MINFSIENGIFNYRVVAVIINNGQLLVHYQNDDTFITLPGGRCEFLETSERAIHRELYEELKLDNVQSNLVWILENFFVYEEKPYHEISFYYEVDIPPTSWILNKTTFIGTETHTKLKFKWIPIDTIKPEDIKPKCLVELLQRKHNGIEHIINNDIE